MNIECFKKVPLLEKVMENGKRTREKLSLKEISFFRKKKIDQLPWEYKRFINPYIYKIGISDGLKAERDKLIAR
jgi:nicotinate phosphoribosyltransferase